MHQCFRHQVKYDLNSSTPNTLHTETRSQNLFVPSLNLLTVNMLNYKVGCKYVSEKHVSTQGHLTTKHTSVSSYIPRCESSVLLTPAAIPL